VNTTSYLTAPTKAVSVLDRRTLRLREHDFALLPERSEQSSCLLRQNKQDTLVKIDYGEARHVLWDAPTNQRELLWKSSFGKQDTIDVFREQEGNFPLPDAKKVGGVDKTTWSARS